MVVTKKQIRAARALLGWTQQDLADRAGTAKQTVVDFERGQRNTYPRTVADIRRTLEHGGVVFIDKSRHGGPGVRLKE